MNYFILYACCIPVRGFKKSIICDLQRGSFKTIPNDLFYILDKFKGKTIENVKANFSKIEHETIDDYFNFLLENEFGFWTDSPEKFPLLDLNYDSPSLISNAIIDLCKDSIHPIDSIFSELDYLGCKDIQLRFFDVVEYDFLESVLKSLEGKRIKSVELIVKYSENQEHVVSNLLTYGRISSLIIHSGVEDKIMHEGFSGMGRVIMVKQVIRDETHCGIVSPLFFSVNVTLFTEAINFNSCLNKKISVDKDGNIKNCPSMITSYGKVGQISLIDVISNTEFNNIQSIRKDAISECQDCEFRYICTDCRAYVKDPNNSFSKPAKCSYNPYEGVWA